jgi:HSP20 family protein
MDTLHQELDNFLKDMFLESHFFKPVHMARSSWRPAMEIKQDEKEYDIKVQLPGVNKEDINVELENDYMTLSAEINQEKQEKDEKQNIQSSEFKYGKYVRTVSFENPIKANEAKAEYKNGILSIKLPKQKIQKHNAKRLEIK